MQGGVCKGVVFSVQDIDTSLVKLLAEDRSPSLIPYITNHDLYLAFEETREALEKYSVSARGQIHIIIPLTYVAESLGSESTPPPRISLNRCRPRIVAALE